MANERIAALIERKRNGKDRGVQVSTTIPAAAADKLDGLATAVGVTRTDLVRDAVTSYLADVDLDAFDVEPFEPGEPGE